MNKKDILLSAENFVFNCKRTYPEYDLMDEQTADEFEKAMSIIRNFDKKEKEKTHKKGKLEEYKQQVIECLRQGCGEEMQLYEEACNKKNIYARRNYIKMFDKACYEFYNGRE